MAKKVMRLVSQWTGEMECKVCHSVHFASIKPMSGGHYYRGSWQCQHGCKLPEKTAGAENRGANASATSRTAR